MRNKPLPGLMKKSSPLHDEKKTYSTKADDPNKKMGYSQSMRKLTIKKKPVPKPTGGFMRPPYKKPVGPTEGPHYVHGYKSNE